MHVLNMPWSWLIVDSIAAAKHLIEHYQSLDTASGTPVFRKHGSAVEIVESVEHWLDTPTNPDCIVKALSVRGQLEPRTLAADSFSAYVDELIIRGTKIKSTNGYDAMLVTMGDPCLTTTAGFQALRTFSGPIRAKLRTKQVIVDSISGAGESGMPSASDLIDKVVFGPFRSINVG